MSVSYARWKYTILLLALLALLVVYPWIREGTTAPAIYNAAIVIVWIAAIVALFQRRQSRLLAALLGFPTLVATFTGYFLPISSPPAAAVFFYLIPVFFLSYAVLSILKSVFAGQEVAVDDINGAFCGYLLITLAFGHLYCFIEAVRPGAFSFFVGSGARPSDPDTLEFLLTYFSLVTLATVGFGDITPAIDATRMLAGVEAVLGQFYVAVIVALLIGMRVSAALQQRDKT